MSATLAPLASAVACVCPASATLKPMPFAEGPCRARNSAAWAVSVIGPLRMDYPRVISVVRDAASQLSRFVAEVYDER